VDVPRNLVTPFIKAQVRNRACLGDPFATGLALAGYWDTADGYGQSTNLYAKMLLERGINVVPYWHPMNPFNDLACSDDPKIRALGEKEPKYLPQIALSITIPEDLYICPPAPCLVSMSMWETDRLPSGRADLFDPFDMVLVPSEFCRQAFLVSGVKTPIRVCPLPLNPMYAPKGRWTIPSRDEPYRFLFVSTPIMRKGIEVLVAAFQKAFPTSDFSRRNVRLHIHSRRWSAAPSLVEEEVRKMVDADKRISQSTKRISDAALLELYGKHHCMVHAAKGEGFGLTVAQSMAMGQPVIAPASTGMADFVTPETAGVVDVEKWVHPTEDGFYNRSTQGHWAVPSVDSLAARMREAYDQRRMYVLRAEKASKKVWAVYNPRAATSSLVQCLTEAWRAAESRTLGQMAEQDRRLRGNGHVVKEVKAR